MTQRLRYDACIPKNLDDEVDSASSLRFVSLHQLVTKNQTLNFFVWIFVVVAIQKKKRQQPGLFSFQIATTKIKTKKIWYLANSWCNETIISDDALEKEGLIMETSTNPNGFSNGVSSDNLYIKFQKGISQHETGKVIHPKCYENSNYFFYPCVFGQIGYWAVMAVLKIFLKYPTYFWFEGGFFISSWAKQVQN